MKAGVIVLAGGEATRLPHKLTLDAGGVPLVVRTLRNVRRGRETVVSCKGSFPQQVDALLDAPLVVDRWPLRGPLAGLLSAMSCMRSRYVFAVAGDAPFVDGTLIDALERQRREGDEAVVPAHREEGTLEPLAALYERIAFLREGFPELRCGRAGVLSVVKRLRARFVDAEDASSLRSINTSADYHEMLPGLRPAGSP